MHATAFVVRTESSKDVTGKPTQGQRGALGLKGMHFNICLLLVLLLMEGGRAHGYMINESTTWTQIVALPLISYKA